MLQAGTEFYNAPPESINRITKITSPDGGQ